MTFFSFTGLVIASTSLSMFIVLMSYSNKTMMHVIWMMFCFSVFLWGVGGFFIGINTNPSQALIIWRLTHVGIIMIPAFFVHFAFEFVRSRGSVIIVINYIIAIAFQLLNNYTKFFINRTRFVFDEFYYDSPATMLYTAFVLWFVGAILFSHLYLYVKSRNFEKVQKKQAHIFIGAMVLSFSGGLTSFFPVYGIDIYPYGNLLTSLYSIVITYAIIKYRFLDMKLTTVRVTKYLVLLGLSSSLVMSLSILKIIPENWIGLGISSMLGTGVFLYIQTWPYWEKIFGVSSISDLIEKTRMVSQSKITFNSIEELELFLNKIFGDQMFAKNVSIVTADNLGKYTEAYNFFSENMGDIYSGDEQIAMKQSRKNTITEEDKDLAHKLCFPIFIEQNKLRGIIVFEQSDEGQLYTVNQINLLKTIVPKINLIYEAIDFNKKLQDEIKIKTKDLEKKTEELFISNEKLRKIDEEKDVFIGMAAHEMRTPMTIMRGYADMLRTEQCGPLSDQQKIMIGKIIDGNESLMTLINDILDLSKIESGKTRFVIEKVDIEKLLEDTYISFQGLMSEKNLAFSLVKKLNYEYEVNTDKGKFILVMTNLLSNAYKYTPEGGEISWGVSTIFKNSQPYLKITVKDSGIGIPKDELPKLFDRFASISTHSKIKTKIQSTGLGLSIVKRIITELGGTIEVESDTDKGATFMIEMPYEPVLREGETI